MKRFLLSTVAVLVCFSTVSCFPFGGQSENSTSGNGDTTEMIEIFVTDREDDEADETEKTDSLEDILGQRKLTVGGKDSAGNTVLINDIEEGIVVSEIAGTSYKGRVMLVDDPSRVFVGMTNAPGECGMRILDMMDHYGAVAGINASAFVDPNECGNGGEVIGLSLSRGQYWGEYSEECESIVFDADNRLLVGNISDWKAQGNLRDGIQSSPVLIANAEKQVTGSIGYGIGVRAAVGQCSNGIIVFVVIDGRSPTYSIGCTVEDIANEMLKYGVINASCCCSNSASVLAYKDEVVNNNCSMNPDIGRLIPNAFLVRSKTADSKE